MADTITAPKGWKASARRARVGEKVALETIEGEYWVRPQKLSVDAAGDLRELILEAGKYATPTTQRLLKEKAVEWLDAHPEAEDGYEPTIRDLQLLMNDEEWERITSIMNVAAADKEQLRLLMIHGIAESNLTDEKGNNIAWSEELVDQLMDFEALAREISGIAQRWNAPLPQGSGDDS